MIGTCDVYVMFIRQKLLKHQYWENITDNIFYNVFNRSVRFEENFKYTENRWNALTLQLSLSLRDKFFFSPEPTVVNLF